MDYALRPGEPMMKGGVISQDYRDKYQAGQQVGMGKADMAKK